jgi:hypothetical protein
MRTTSIRLERLRLMKKKLPRRRELRAARSAPLVTAEPPFTPLVAMTLATDAADFMEADEEHHNDLVGTALAVGEWLADVGRPGRWDTLEVAALIDLLPDSNGARDRFLFTLIGLLGFAALDERLPEPSVERSLREVACLTDDPIIANTALDTIRRLKTPGFEQRQPAGIRN